MQQPRGAHIVEALVAKGVSIPNPWAIDIAEDVDPDRISADGVVLHQGIRLRGARTTISAGCELGAEGPVTVDDCQLGPNVALKGGYFTRAVFLAGASMTLGAHVREGTILEESASAAHTVGLKQTILFPFATLGSLINFCDAMLTGGTSGSDHSEVGSSYIHFNFTPDGDKSTPSLFGDVPRGVLLDRPPVFLGGQGGAVGPVRTGFGVVVGAGSVLREDVAEDDLLVLPESVGGIRRPNKRHGYKRLAPILEKNLAYIGSLVALDAWYAQARAPFFAHQEFGELVLDGARGALAAGLKERTKRLGALIGRVEPTDDARRELVDAKDAVLAACATLDAPAPAAVLDELRARAASGIGYVEAIQGLDDRVRAEVTGWLGGIVDEVCARAAAPVPALGLFAAKPA